VGGAVTILGAVLNVVMPIPIFLLMDRVFHGERYLDKGLKAWWDRNVFWIIGCIVINFVIDFMGWL
jgi:hypothetical protein